MNQKGKTYLLLTAVFFVWSIIGYKIYQYLNPDNDKPQKDIIQNQFPKKTSKTINYQMHSNYRDPFLGEFAVDNSVEKNNINLVPPIQTIKTINTTDNIILPAIEYKGMVNPQAHTKDAVFIIEINGKNEFYRINSLKDSILLINGNQKKISIKYKNKKWEIPYRQ